MTLVAAGWMFAYTLASNLCSEATNMLYLSFSGLCFGWGSNSYLSLEWFGDVPEGYRPRWNRFSKDWHTEHCYDMSKVIYFLMNCCVIPIRFHFPDYLYLSWFLPQIFQQICGGGQKAEVCLAWQIPIFLDNRKTPETMFLGQILRLNTSTLWYDI